MLATTELIDEEVVVLFEENEGVDEKRMSASSNTAIILRSRLRTAPIRLFIAVPPNTNMSICSRMQSAKVLTWGNKPSVKSKGKKRSAS